jgi:hypothetical protein
MNTNMNTNTSANMNMNTRTIMNMNVKMNMTKYKYISKPPAQGSIYWKIPPPCGGWEISADVMWGKKYKKAKRKRRKM